MVFVKPKAAANIGVPDSELEEARSICKDIQRRKDLVSKMRKVRKVATLSGYHCCHCSL